MRHICAFFARRAHLEAFIERNRQLYDASHPDDRMNIHAAAFGQFKRPDITDSNAIRLAFLERYK